MITTKVCKKCGEEKKLSEFKYHSPYCKKCAYKNDKRKTNSTMKNKHLIYGIMKEWHKDTCNNDCEGCGFHKYCQQIIDIFEDTNWSEGEG